MRYTSFVIVAGLCAGIVAPSLVAVEPRPPEPPSAQQQQIQKIIPSITEELPDSFVPRKPRSEADKNRLEALALFAAGRMKEHQKDLLGALCLYQRALRHDPKALPVLEQIVPLAFNLNRPTEAVRYALKAVELDPSDPQLLKRLGVHLSEQGDFKGAVKLYEKALSLESGDKKTASYVVMKLEMGRLYYIVKDYPQAAAAFAEVMDAFDKPADYGIDANLRRELMKEPAKVYSLFGDCFIDAALPDRAEAAYRKSHEAAKGKDTAAQAYHLARVHAARNEPKKALEQLQVYLEARGTSEGTAPYELLAESLKKAGQEVELMARLEKARGHDPENQVLGYFLAERLREAGKLDESLAIFLALHKKSASVQTYQGLTAIYHAQKQAEPLLAILGQCASETGGLDSLDEELKSLVADSHTVAALLKVAEAKLSPKPENLDYGGRLAAAMLALEVKRWDAADKFFTLALASKPKEAAEVYLMWGLGLLGDEKYAEAAAVFQTGLDEKALPKDNPAFYYYLSGAWELAGETSKALEAARQAVKLAGDSPRMHSRVAWIMYHAKRYDEAFKAYGELIERFDASNGTPEGRQVLREARLALSNLAVIRKDIPLAVEWLEQVLDEFPEDIAARNDLGYLWADQGKNLPRALEMTREAVAAEPENAAYRDSLGWALYRLGRYDEALVELKKAASGEKTDGVILDHLGDCYHKLNDKPNALDCWRRALEQFDKNDDDDEIKATQMKIKQDN